MEINEEKKHTSVYLDPKIFEAVKKLAKGEGRSLTKQIERILQEWLEKKKLL